MKKILFALIFIFNLMFNITIPAFATSNDIVYSTQTVNTTNDSSTITNADIESGGLPNVTIEQASSWIDRKGFEVIKFLQKIAQPFAIIIFIISAGMLLIGTVSDSDLSSKGIWGMVIAILMYAVVLYAPELVQMGLNWLRS